MAKLNIEWDPLSNPGPGAVSSRLALFRVKKDLMLLFTEPPPGLFVTNDDDDFMTIHALILGTMDTPYEGGFFYFIIRCTSDYPILPPKVRFMTTDAGRVRFNPNLYNNGKVCLSILGTFEGPGWSPAQQLSSLLISIQSLLNEKPYHNEPGFETERFPGDAKRYNQIIQHETLRVAVIGMIRNEQALSIPSKFKTIMEQTFLQFYEHYTDVAKTNLHLDGQRMMDPFGNLYCGNFQYKNILKNLENIHKDLLNKPPAPIPTSPACTVDANTNDEDTMIDYLEDDDLLDIGIDIVESES